MTSQEMEEGGLRAYRAGGDMQQGGEMGCDDIAGNGRRGLRGMEGGGCEGWEEVLPLTAKN